MFVLLDADGLGIVSERWRTYCYDDVDGDATTDDDAAREVHVEGGGGG